MEEGKSIRRSFICCISSIFSNRNGKDGKACVLKALCETEKLDDNDAGLGTFVQEILKAIFR
jgi:DM4/DM12 family